jgi:putative oxidoreductase
MERTTLEESAKLIGRMLMSLLFIWSGYGKTQAYEGVGQYMTMNGVSSSLLPLVILAEIGFGL